MPVRRTSIAVAASVLLMFGLVYAYTRSPVIEADSWETVLTKISCSQVSKFDDVFKIKGTVIVARTSFHDPILVASNLIDKIRERCF
jgi:hypothetical protein